MAEAPGQMVADFRRFYGLSLATIRDSGIPLHEVADMAVHLPIESATHRAVNPHWQRTPELDLLRDMEHRLRVLAWQQTEKGSRGRDYPEPVRLPWDPEPAGVVKGDRMTTDEWDKHLGWDKLRMKEA